MVASWEQSLHTLLNPDFFEMTEGSVEMATQHAMFEREIALLSALHHPNIVKLHGVVSNAGGIPVWMVMEKGDCDLLTYLQRKTEPMFLVELVRRMLDVASGLAYMHSLDPPMMHRDVSLRNILVFTNDDGSSCLKLADMGLSKFRRPGTAGPASHTAGIGAPFFAAPEASTTDYDVSRDTFSFGMVMAMAVVIAVEGVSSPRRAYDRITYDERAQVVRDACARLHEVGGSIGRSLAELLQSCCSLEPTQRPVFSEIKLQLTTLVSQARGTTRGIGSCLPT